MTFCASTRAHTLHHHSRIRGEGSNPIEVRKTMAGVGIGISLPEVSLAAVRRGRPKRPHDATRVVNE